MTNPRPSTMRSIGRTSRTTLTLVAAFIVFLGVGAPANAQPATPLGIDFGSSDVPAPGPGTGTGDRPSNTYVSFDNFDLSSYPAGTKIESAVQQYGDCSTNPTPQGVWLVSNLYNPFASCYWGGARSEYQIVFVTPAKQRVLINWYVQLNKDAISARTTGSIHVNCPGSWGGVACGSDDLGPHALFVDWNAYPESKVYPPPNGADVKWGYCATETLACTAPAGSTIAFGYGDKVVKAVKGQGDLMCTAASFKNIDPVPNTVKHCWIVG